MDRYIELLRKQGLSLIIVKGEKTIFESSGDGIRPIFDAVNSVGLAGLRGCVVVDKVVGKAAALLITFIKAGEVHCETISHRGRAVLDKTGIKYYAKKVIPEVLNKAGTDICPFEKEVLDIDEPKNGYNRLYNKLISMTDEFKC